METSIAPDRVLELVVFKLKVGVTHEQFLSTVDPVSDWARQQPGFVSRELSYSEAAADAAMSSGSCAPMLA